MKIAQGVKTLRGRPVIIPDCSRDDLPEFFLGLGFKVGVEVGVCKARYTEVLAKSGLTIYGVDPWLSYPDYAYDTPPEYQYRFDANYEYAKKKLAKYPNCTLIRKMSMEAVKDFANESIDFVYIDGNHSFQYVAEDICQWIKKVKTGGYVCGHDYIYSNPLNFHVRYVIDAYVASHGISNLWVLGRKKKIKGEKRDQWRSWLFQKGDLTGFTKAFIKRRTGRETD